LLDINYSLDNAYNEKAKRCAINISKKRFLSSISYFYIRKKMLSANFSFQDHLSLGILSFISIQYQFNLHDQFLLDFFQNKIFDDKSKDGALWSILCSILPYMLRIKKNNERYQTIQSIFF